MVDYEVWEETNDALHKCRKRWQELAKRIKKEIKAYKRVYVQTEEFDEVLGWMSELEEEK